MKDITARCQNCGGLKRQHGTKKPWRCPTGLQESYWLPWTVEAWKAAEEAGKKKATV